MHRPTDADLYRRGCQTLLASWEEYARGALDAAVEHLPGVTAAVFPREPERDVYNNALLDRDLAARERTDALESIAAVYASAGVHRFAVWVHETDVAMRYDLERRGYALDTTTCAMGMVLDSSSTPRLEIEFVPADWSEYLSYERLPPNFLSRANHASLHVLVHRIDGDIDSGALAYDFDGDCGIYNVGTIELARRRGLATAATAAQLRDALARGCQTASLQSTPTAERIYTALGFRNLGRFLEYVPSR